MSKFIFRREEWMDWSSQEYTDYILEEKDGRRFRNIKGKVVDLPGNNTVDTWIGVNSPLILGVNVFGLGGYYEGHKHETSQFFYIIAGKARVKVGDEEKIAEKDTWVFTPPDVEHSIVNIGDQDLAYITIGGLRRIHGSSPLQMWSIPS